MILRLVLITVRTRAPCLIPIAATEWTVLQKVAMVH